VYDLVDDVSIWLLPNNFSETPCILRKIEKWKLGKNLKVRVRGDPSAMIGLRILDVATFCFGGLRQRGRFGMKWENGRRPNFDTGKRRLRRLKQWEKDWGSDIAYQEEED